MTPLQVPGGDVVGLAVIGSVLLIGLAFFGAILYAEHRKEMKLIESGQYPATRQDAGTWVLAAGLLLLALGLADLLRAVWLGAVPEDGLTLTLLGVAALAYFAFRRREARRSTDSGTGTPADRDDTAGNED
ncbi:hypothetical protein [Haloplanus halophilus]|uniref:hypothetical protein n=1 Tax=Haloplanus halophilus TaxID=2949993 RepID=UPI00203AA6E0|nr:hypothetical protein [Haloplanus sp. GDY1]